MRWLLLWQTIVFNPQTITITWTDGVEPHLSAHSCRLAQQELRVIAGIKSLCVPQERAPERFGTMTTRRFLVGNSRENFGRIVLFGNAVDGRFISRHEGNKK